jgi:hypothetical protein
VHKPSRFGAITAIAVTALVGAACEADGGGESPGEQTPADGGTEDEGLY